MDTYASPPKNKLATSSKFHNWVQFLGTQNGPCKEYEAYNISLIPSLLPPHSFSPSHSIDGVVEFETKHHVFKRDPNILAC